MKKYVISIDQGTTSSRCIIFNENADVVAVEQVESDNIITKEGYVEQDAMKILNDVKFCLENAIAKANISADEIDSIGITNQRETIVAWDKKTGKPYYNAIIWQCKRTSDYCDTLKEDIISQGAIKEKTGLMVDAYFSASKMKWLIDNVKEIKENETNVLMGTIDTWLIWNLTKEKSYLTDYTNASRTMLFNIKELVWDQSLLEMFGVKLHMLPRAVPSSYNFGTAEINGVNIPITGVAGDQQAALFGQKCFTNGMVKVTYGTGCFLLMNIGEKLKYSNSGLLTTIAATADAKVQYAFEGSVFMAGALMKWLRDEMGLFTDVSKTAEMAQLAGDNKGVYFVPAFAGLGAPYWDSKAKATIIGMTMGVNRNHIVRSALESIAYQNYDVIMAMEDDLDGDIAVLKVDGGASKNDFLMQFQADITSKDLQRPKMVETTALGAAFLAGLKTGFWTMDKINNMDDVDSEYNAFMSQAEKRKLIKGWKSAVEKSRDM